MYVYTYIRITHQVFHTLISEQARKEVNDQERQELLGEREARLAFKQRIQSLVEQYRKLEEREELARREAQQSQERERRGLQLQALEDDARKMAAVREEVEEE
jgi:hypothetical protein